MRVSISTTIVEKADHIAAFISGIDVEADFRSPSLFVAPSFRKVWRHGEAAARISEASRLGTPRCLGPRSSPFPAECSKKHGTRISGSTGRWYGLETCTK